MQQNAITRMKNETVKYSRYSFVAQRDPASEQLGLCYGHLSKLLPVKTSKVRDQETARNSAMHIPLLDSTWISVDSN